MSGFLPASVAIRERLRRARVVGLLLGLCQSGVALGQIPVAAPPPVAAEGPPSSAPPAPAPAPPAAPSAATALSPPAAPEPTDADSGGERSGAEVEQSHESNHVPLR